MAPINTGKEGNLMKKNLRVPVLAAALAGAMVLGAGATTVAERVSADLRPDITVTVDGKDQTLLDKNGDVVYPITYAGTTYLPIRALGNVMDLDVEWNGKTQTISLYTRTDTKPEDLTLEKLTVRAEEAEQAVNDLKAASTYAGRRDQYDLHSDTIEDIREDLYEFAQLVNRQYRDGEMETADFNVLTTKIDKLDNRLKDALEDLRVKTIDNESGKLTVYEEHEQIVDELESRMKEIEADIKAIRPAGTYAKRLEQYNAVAGDLHLVSRDVSTEYRNLGTDRKEDRLSSKEYTAFNDKLDALDNRVKSAWGNLADKTVGYDESDAQSGVSGGATYDGYVSEISGLDDRADELVQEVRNFKTADGAQAWKTLEKKIETLEDELDRLEDKIERSYRDDKLTTTEFRALDRLLDQTDDKIDDLDDRYDDWYDDHDDDWDDDWDDDHDDWED